MRPSQPCPCAARYGQARVGPVGMRAGRRARCRLSSLLFAVVAGLPSADAAALQHWQLLSHEGSTASMSGPEPESPGRVRVLGRPTPNAQAWHLQLVYGPLCIREMQGLLVSFRVRADRPRLLGVSLGLNQAPWTLLAPYRTVQVSQRWEDVVLFLVPEAGADPGRLVFDLAASDAAVDIDSVVVRRRDNSESIVLSGARCAR